MNDLYEIYTDGGCFPNPGRGSWAFVVVKNGLMIEEKTGTDENTTNNRMEYLAVINALKMAKLMGVPAVVRSDSELLVNTYNLWMDNWARLGWKRPGKIKEIKNLDLVQELFALKRTMQNGVVVKWVRGHNGNQWNEHCDELCNQLLTPQYIEESTYKLLKTSKKDIEKMIYYTGRMIEIIDGSQFETEEKDITLDAVNLIRNFFIDQKTALDAESI